jgi:sugar transferase (PEP-CTERM/EpsH1 system associated)
LPELLFLAHRIPYPPDKGDKIRSWHFLQHLAGRYRVHLGCFVDDPRDWQFEGQLRKLCDECCFAGLNVKAARLRSLAGVVRGLPLTLPYYFDRRLARWVRELLVRRPVETAFVYCSAMAQYVEPAPSHPMRRVIDLVDLDSQKWREYAEHASGLKRWLLNREARALFNIESSVASKFDATLLATRVEAEQFARIGPVPRQRIYAVPNGVDGAYFSPDQPIDNPYEPGRVPIVFTGAMDYQPNIDAVRYFATAILPAVRNCVANAMFVVVGSNPPQSILALADGKTVIVTGRVADVRPYTAHARVIVAPLRMARGIQNKVLEGMAMAKPVVASAEAVAGIEAEIGKDLLVADNAAAFAKAVCEAAIESRGREVGNNARHRVLADYTWAASLRRLDRVLAGEAGSLVEERLRS